MRADDSTALRVLPEAVASPTNKGVAEVVDQENLPAYTRAFWGKSDRNNPSRIHLLEHHLADVGACFEALLQQPTIRRRLARAGNLDDLDPVTVARLCLFACLHDIGKVNVGFQAKIWRDEDWPANAPRINRAEHTLDLAPVMDPYKDTETAAWFFDALNWEEMLDWDGGGGLTVCGLFTATLSHHGLPLHLEGKRDMSPLNWRPLGTLHPRSYTEEVGRMVKEWFKEAFSESAPPLPPAPAFQHMFLGLCALADWVGSNEAWFEFHGKPVDNYFQAVARPAAARAVAEIGLDLAAQRLALEEMPIPGFAQLFDLPGSPQPHPIQQSAIEVPPDEPLVIIESETGSGKTEAALWRFARMFREGLVDGLYFALPTRAAASQIHRRIRKFVANMFPSGFQPEPILAVPGYLRAGDAVGHQALHSYDAWWEDHPDDATRHRRWAAENAKRYLAAQIAVGTVDQAMMAALKVKHSHLRAACLARNLLIVDEVHASDPYMRQVLSALLDAHLGSGGYALLMSATLGAGARRQWMSRASAFVDSGSLDEDVAAPYPAITYGPASAPGALKVGGNHQEKSVSIQALPAMPDFALVASRAFDAARAGAKVLVIRNTVTFAVATQQALEETSGDGDGRLLFSCDGVPTLHHGRFAVPDRKRLDQAVEEQIGRYRPDGGCIIVGTQTLEQSLDIDADLLITDLCPMDVLLQRIGRLHRHQRQDRPRDYATPTCVVLTPPEDDLSPLLVRRRDSNGLGPHGYVYEDLRVLEATRQLVEQYSASGEPWRIPQMNRALVERATHHQALAGIVDAMGDAWVEHANNMKGARMAEGLTARQAVVRRDRAFYPEDENREVVFGTLEERIRTRLGDEGINVELNPPAPSHFSPEVAIDEITIPDHLRGGQIPDDSVTPELVEGGFSFPVGNRTFLYDRLGLRPLRPA